MTTLTLRSVSLTVTGCLAAAVLSASCGSSNGPTEPPSPGPQRYEGQWTGTTSQGRAIAFVVSADQKVTEITIGYSFGNCTGAATFSNLNVDIGLPGMRPGFPPPAAPTTGPGFQYGSGSPESSNYTQIYGAFPTGATASGYVAFLDFQGCGNAIGLWNATRR